MGRALVPPKGIIPHSPYFMEAVLLLAKIKPKTALCLGGGACILPTHMATNLDTVVDVVDPDKEMFDVAEKYFNYKPSGLSYVSTGEKFLETTENKYDIIILDAYDEYKRVPALYSNQAYLRMSEISPRLLINFIGRTNDELEIHLGMLTQLYGSVKHFNIPAKGVIQEIILCDGTK
jgi:hypothetical protein